MTTAATTSHEPPVTQKLARLFLSEHLVLWLSVIYFAALAPFTPGFTTTGNLGNILATLAPALCLAQPGGRYVVYLRQGGTATVRLAAGSYAVMRNKPHTGQSAKLGKGSGGAAWTTPAVTDTENWLFTLEAQR